MSPHRAALSKGEFPLCYESYQSASEMSNCASERVRLASPRIFYNNLMQWRRSTYYEKRSPESSNCTSGQVRLVTLRVFHYSWIQWRRVTQARIPESQESRQQESPDEGQTGLNLESWNEDRTDRPHLSLKLKGSQGVGHSLGVVESADEPRKPPSVCMSSEVLGSVYERGQWTPPLVKLIRTMSS